MSLRKELPSTSKMLSDVKFLQVVQDHFPYIRKNTLYTSSLVNDITVDIYRGDFHGLLLSLNSQREMLHFNTIFNGYLSPLDFRGESKIVKLIDPNFIQGLYNTYKVKMQ